MGKGILKINIYYIIFRYVNYVRSLEKFFQKGKLRIVNVKKYRALKKNCKKLLTVYNIYKL